MSEIASEYQQQFRDISSKCYAEQAKFFLNAFWEELQGEAENFWKFVHLCNDLDVGKKANGSELNEFQAHQLLEKLGETLTVQEMRIKLREIDIDFNKHVSLIEYLIFRYKKTVKALVTAPQPGTNAEELEEATRLVDSAQSAFSELSTKLESQKQALAELTEKEGAAKEAESAAKTAAETSTQAAEASKAAEDKAKAAADIVVAAEAEAQKAAAEQKSALDELKSQEDQLSQKISELTIKSEDGGVVSRGKAKQELEQLKSEDPLPLRRAKINQEATVRKAEKARLYAEEQANIARAAADAASQAARHAEETARQATEAAENAAATAKQLTEARQQTEEIAAQVEVALTDAEKKLQEATDYLTEVKKRPNQAFGDLWWLSRELEEKKKYLPKRLQK